MKNFANLLSILFMLPAALHASETNVSSDDNEISVGQAVSITLTHKPEPAKVIRIVKVMDRGHVEFFYDLQTKDGTRQALRSSFALPENISDVQSDDTGISIGQAVSITLTNKPEPAKVIRIVKVMDRGHVEFFYDLQTKDGTRQALRSSFALPENISDVQSDDTGISIGQAVSITLTHKPEPAKVIRIVKVMDRGHVEFFYDLQTKDGTKQALRSSFALPENISDVQSDGEVVIGQAVAITLSLKPEPAIITRIIINMDRNMLEFFYDLQTKDGTKRALRSGFAVAEKVFDVQSDDAGISIGQAVSITLTNKPKPAKVMQIKKSIMRGLVTYTYELQTEDGEETSYHYRSGFALPENISDVQSGK